jgi:hypothetical protein
MLKKKRVKRKKAELIAAGDGRGDDVVVTAASWLLRVTCRREEKNEKVQVYGISRS